MGFVATIKEKLFYKNANDWLGITEH